MAADEHHAWSGHTQLVQDAALRQRLDVKVGHKCRQAFCAIHCFQTRLGHGS